jgi:hypothetical protein
VCVVEKPSSFFYKKSVWCGMVTVKILVSHVCTVKRERMSRFVTLVSVLLLTSLGQPVEGLNPEIADEFGGVKSTSKETAKKNTAHILIQFCSS